MRGREGEAPAEPLIEWADAESNGSAGASPSRSLALSHGNEGMDDLILPRGYRFAGVHCGIKPDGSKLDLGLMVSDRPAVAAGVFTQNRVTAAPVKVSRQRVPTANTRGVVICSGNANACTGEQGLEDARRMTEIAAEAT